MRFFCTVLFFTFLASAASADYRQSNDLVANLQIQTSDQAAVERAARETHALPAYVTASGENWTGLHLKLTESQVEKMITDLGARVSKSLNYRVMAFTLR